MQRPIPGKLNYLNSGNGTGAHLLLELLARSSTGSTSPRSPTEGLPPGVQDAFVSGVVSTTLCSTSGGPLTRAGRTRATPAARRRHHGQGGGGRSLPLYGRRLIRQLGVRPRGVGERSVVGTRFTMGAGLAAIVRPLAEKCPGRENLCSKSSTGTCA